MSTNEQTPLSQPTSAVRNTLGKEQAPQNLVRPISDEDLQKYCDKNYHQILPLIAEKLHQEKAQQEKLKAIKARLNFKEASQYSKSETPNRRRNLKERLGPRIGDKDKNVSAHSRGSERKSYYSSRRDPKSCYHSSHSKETETASEKHYHKREYSRRTEAVSESEESASRHWKSKPKKQKSSMEDDLSQPWVCEEMDPFTPRIRYFDFPKTRMPSHIKTYDGSEDPKDHLKIFQTAAKTKRRAMPTWCHMFNSTLTENARVWFDDLPKDPIDSYDDLRKAFLENYLQQKKCIKDPVEIHNIKQRNRESTEEFVRRYKLELRDVKGASECMKISGFMHGIINPELIKRLHDKIPKSMDEMMSVTTAFLRGEVAASNQERKKSFPSWKQEAGQKQNFKRGNFRNEQRMERKQDRFTLLTKTPREILALDKGKFKSRSPMTTPVEKRNASKFCEFHGEVRHTTDECMHLKRQIEEMLKARKLSHLIKKLKQNHRKDQAKIAKKGKTPRKEKPLAILMVQPWQRIARKRITQTFSSESLISFPTLGEEDGTKGPMIIEAEMGGHFDPREHPLVGFSGEIIWPLGHISLLVKIGDEEHSMSAQMNFMVVRSPSPYNGIIGRPGSSRIIPQECSIVLEPGVPRPIINQVKEEKIQVAIHPEQTVAIGSTLTEEGRKELCGLLRRHLDVFTWKPGDMNGVPRHIAEHRLNVREGCLPIRQKKRGLAPERNKAISEEVKKLVEAEIMKEVHYHSWLSNPVMVKKHDDSWRMCVDFKDLNKACPKDGYPLSKIDWKVESLCGYPYKCFMDAYKGYHQIKMAEEDEKKTAFITSQGIFLKAVLDLPSPKCLKDVQKLNGKLASLNIFMSKSAEKSLPFFKTLKKCTKKSDFQWTPKAEGAFKEMKQSIVEPPMLMALKEKEELIMYLAAAKETISAVLMKERDGKQVPIYFVSRALQGPEINYTPMEKLILALVSASKRLKRYFRAHNNCNHGSTNKQLLSNPEVTGRLLKWIFELGEHDIQYRPRTSVKGQILADFIVEHPEDDTPDIPMEDKEELPDPWILFTDGSLCIDGSAAGLIIMNPEGMEFTYALRFRFNATNNKAEYEALVAGLQIARKIGVQNLQANVDSKLVANQVNEINIAKESSMIRYLEKVKNLANTFKGFSIKQIPRGENKKANALSKIASTSFAHLSKQVLMEELREKEIDEKEILAVVEEEGHTWMTPVYEYLTEGILPKEKKKVRIVRRKAGRYAVINEVLYKKSFFGPWLWCVGPLQANYVLRKIHEGSCSMHVGPRSVVAKALSPSSRAKNPQEKLTPITSPWPFYKWGIDIAGPFSEGPGKVKFLIVAMDYFTKWIEATPVETIIGTQVKKFVWDNIVSRFGLPGEIVSDNGKQFRDDPFKDCLGEGIKARLGKNKNWVEEVSHVLWAHCTMIKSSNGETPFSLTYGAEAVIPAEIGMPTLRTAEVDMVKNNEALGISLGLLEEKREQAAIQEAKNKAKMKGYYNARVRSTSFRPRDFVYRSNEASHAKDRGKLRPKWEGPYEVTKALGKGAYRLRNHNGHTIREHGISATLKSVICMKCKHPLHVKQSGKKDTDGILFVCNIFKFFLMNEKVKPSYLHPF
nr:reverse transcriptase domain-containing protein [Tanacetum cinerariifolium]